MRIDSRSGLRGMLINADTGEPIRWAKWADTDTGEYEAFSRDPAEVEQLGLPLAAYLYYGRASLRFVAAPAVATLLPPAHRVGAGEFSPHAKEEIRRRYREVGEARRILATAGVECECPGCHRLATWKTGDVVECEPILGDDGKPYRQSITIRGHCYCDRHYRPPVATSLRGVEAEVAVGARPQ